jgi:hypothetical protein
MPHVEQELLTLPEQLSFPGFKLSSSRHNNNNNINRTVWRTRASTDSLFQWVLIVLHYSLICFYTHIRQTSTCGAGTAYPSGATEFPRF